MEWPLDLPARTVLSLPGGAGTPGAIPWAVFNAAWYRRAYGLAADHDAAALLKHYLTIGQAEAYSPNPLFDEAWHRAEYPRIAAAIAAGDYTSAFDAYCRRGCLDRSGHWLFDELAYRDRYRDLTHEVFAQAELANGYDHYLRHGVEEDRVGHLLFDPETYLANFDAADVPAVRQAGVFQHYLDRLERGEPELRTSIYFDPDWYRRRYPDVARSIAEGRWKSALHHYLCNDKPTDFDPLEGFSEAHYLGNDPGLRTVVADRHFRNGYMHFLRFGTRELRAPSASLDLAWYADQPTVRADIDRGLAADAFTHWLKVGSQQGLPPVRPAAQRIEAEQAAALVEQMTTAMLPVIGRFGYRFDQPDAPVVSVVLVARDGFAATMATIGALRASTTLPLELVIVDVGASDETAALGQHVPGAKVLRLEAETSWSRAADAGRQWATAPLVLFLSAAAQVGFNAIDRARARLTDDATAGAVGGLILQPHGVIAQAGGIVWQNGGTHDYMAGASPLAPEATFVRAVDFVSAAFLLVRTELMTQLDGFDHACGTGYEAVDLCLRINAAGLRVVFDLSVIVTERMPDAPRGAPPQHFRDKHAAFLDRRPAAGGPVQVFARHAGPKLPHILFIEDTVPLRRIGSGFVRSNEIVRAMVALGAAVTVFPVNGCDLPLAGVFGDMPDTVEVMHNLALDKLSSFLLGRLAYYDLIWVARVHNLEKIKPILDRMHGQDTAAPPIILDTEALTPYREAQRIALSGGVFDPEPAMQAMQDLMRLCTATVAVTVEETALLQDRGVSKTFTIGHAIEARPTLRPFAQRSGMLFVGAIHTADSPNLDSLHWFVDAVLPLIEEDLGWETRLTIAGYVAPGIDISRFRHHPRITLRGSQPDLDPLYNTSRVFVAPTRYAAGAPYKVLEAASRGIPVVCTEVLRRQMGWTSEQDIIAADAADPVAFAAAILALYHDEGLWRTVREGALRRLRREHRWADFMRSVAQAVTAKDAA